MTTEIDLYALKQLSELEAARALTALELGELWAIVSVRGLKVKRGAERADLVAAILAYSHPRPAPVVEAPQFEQLRMC
jgi:hypothetical protein